MSTTWLLPLGLLVISAPTLAQLDTASLSGRINDSSGAVLAGAAMAVVNTETNPSGNEATTVADGGVPMMNLTLKFVW